MSKIYIRKKLSNEVKEANSLKKEIILIRQKEADFKRIKKNAQFVKRAKRRNKFNKLIEKKFKAHSIALESDLPKSEQWFRPLYTSENITRNYKEDLYCDKFNEPVNNRYIPDVHNKGYKYIIEIDGSWHDKPDEIIRDAKKDYYFLKRGYCVIRIKAYDQESYKVGIEKLKAHIRHMETNIIKR